MITQQNNIEIIKDQSGLILAIKIPNSYNVDGIEFVTDQNDDLQVGFMSREKGYRIRAHKHKRVVRQLSSTQEVLFVQDGQVDVKIFDQANQFTSEFRLLTGDVLVLQRGGHSFEFTKDTRIVEVKQGPYMGLDEKEFF